MNPQDLNQSHQQPAVKNPLSVMQTGEHVICEIKRHPFGILMIYLGEGLLLIVLSLIALGVAPSLLGDNSGQAKAVGAVLFFIFALASLAFVFVATVVYWGNRWVVTSDSITQVTQTGLFHKQSSQLSLGNLEDVTAEQNGVMANLLHFGVLRAETAGETSKFVFQFCPNPNYYAQKILAAREVFEQSGRKGDEPQLSSAQSIPENQIPTYSQAPPAPHQPVVEQNPVYPSQPLQPPPQYSQPNNNHDYPENNDSNQPTGNY